MVAEKSVEGSIPTIDGGRAPLKLVERGGAARFAWDEFFYAEHQNSNMGLFAYRPENYQSRDSEFAFHVEMR